MNTHVPPDVIKKTAHCFFSFRCLSDGHHPKCEVDHAAGENVLFLKSEPEGPCAYLMTFAGRHVCRCPTHYYLFKTQVERD